MTEGSAEMNQQPEKRAAPEGPRRVKTVVVNGEAYKIDIDERVYQEMEKAKKKQEDEAAEKAKERKENAKKYDPFNKLSKNLEEAKQAIKDGKEVKERVGKVVDQLEQYLPEHIGGRSYAQVAEGLKAQNAVGEFQLDLIKQHGDFLSEFSDKIKELEKLTRNPILNTKGEFEGWGEIDEALIVKNAADIEKILDWLDHKDGKFTWKETRKMPKGTILDKVTGEVIIEGDEDEMAIEAHERETAESKSNLDKAYTLVKANLVDFTHEYNDVSNPGNFESSVNMMMQTSENDLFKQGGQYELLQFNAEKRRYDVNFEHLTLWIRDQMYYWSDFMDDGDVDLWQMIRFDTTFRGITLFELVAYDPGKYFKTKYDTDEDADALGTKYKEYRNFLITIVSPSSQLHNLGAEHIKVRKEMKALVEHWKKIDANDLFFNSRWLRLMNSFSAKEIAKVFNEGEDSGDFHLDVYNPEKGSAGKGFKDGIMFFDSIRELSEGNLSFQRHYDAKTSASVLEKQITDHEDKAREHEAEARRLEREKGSKADIEEQHRLARMQRQQAEEKRNQSTQVYEPKMNAVWDQLGKEGSEAFAQTLIGNVIKSEFVHLLLVDKNGKIITEPNGYGQQEPANYIGGVPGKKLFKDVINNDRAREAVLHVMEQQLVKYEGGVTYAQLLDALNNDHGKFLQYALNLSGNQKYKQEHMNIFTGYGEHPRSRKNIILEALADGIQAKSKAEDEAAEKAHKAAGKTEPYQKRRMNSIEARLAVDMMYYSSFFMMVAAKNDQSLTGDNVPARLMHPTEFLFKNYHHNTMGRMENYPIIEHMPTMLDGLTIDVDVRQKGVYGVEHIQRQQVTMAEYARGKSRLGQADGALSMIHSEFPELGAQMYLGPMNNFTTWFDLIRKSADLIDLSDASLSPDAHGSIPMNWKEVQKYHELWNILRELFEKHPFLYSHYTRVWDTGATKPKEGSWGYSKSPEFKTVRLYEYLFGEQVQKTLKAFRDIDIREGAKTKTLEKEIVEDGYGSTMESNKKFGKEIEAAVEACYHGATTFMYNHASTGMPQWGTLERLQQQMVGLMNIPMGIEWYRDANGVLRSRPVGKDMKFNRAKVEFIIGMLGDVNMRKRYWGYVGGETGSVSWSIFSAFFQEFFKQAMKSVFEG